MAEKDITEKTLEAYNDIFADIVNVLLFKGELVVKSKTLTDVTTKSQYKADGKLHEQERDVAKYWQRGHIRMAIYGLENQTAIDKDMPLRVIAYDGASYRNQLNADVSGKRKRYPVVTLVLYFGKRHWQKQKSLLQCFEVPERLKPYVSDYKINVFEIAYLTLEQVEMFKSDFKVVAEYFVHKRLYKDYRPSIETLKHVDAVLKLMTVLTDDPRFEEKINEFQDRRDVTMCEILDKIEARGVAKGRIEGRAEGRAEGKAEERAIQTREFAEAMLRNNEPISKIKLYTKLTTKKIQEIAAQIGVAVVM